MSRPTQERMNDDSNPFKTQPDRSADNRLFQEFLEDENAKDANDVQVQRQIFLTHAPFKKAKLKVR